VLYIFVLYTKYKVPLELTKEDVLSEFTEDEETAYYNMHTHQES
jgi:hypothetical protein